MAYNRSMDTDNSTMESYRFIGAIFTVLYVGLAVAKPEQTWIDKYKTAIEVCIKEQNVDKDKVYALLKEAHPPEGDEIKCFLGCMMLKMDYYKDGKYDWDYLKKSNNAFYEKPEDIEKANTAADICQQKVPMIEDTCELAEQITNCYYAESRKLDLDQPHVL